MTNPIRILQIVPNMQQGGLENFIMNIYRNIDRTKVQFDFLVHYNEKKFFDDEIEKLGGKIYRFSLRDDNNIIKYIKELNKFYKEHPEYKVIHCHMSSIGFLNFIIAKRNGIKVRIAHSHNANTEKSLKGFIKKILIKPLKYVSTVNFACSQKAGKFLFGNKRFEVIYNAIDVHRFEYNPDVRKKIREEYNLEDFFVVGHIGRFNVQKNHEFLIDVFNELLKSKQKLKLILIGEGELQDKIKNKVKELKIEDNVLFLGVRNNVNEFYQAMDCFVLPSFFEGLPVVGVEAQASGLTCIFSDRITKEINLTEKVKFVSINSINDWINALKNLKLNDDRKKNLELIYENYEIKNIAQKLECEYLKLFYSYKGEN